MDAGLLSEKFRFEKRGATVDGYGNFEGDWVTQFTVWTQQQDLRGGETVMAARLSGRQPAVVSIRNSIQARQITTDWRAVNARTGVVWNIRSISMAEDSGHLDLLCEKGVAP